MPLWRASSVNALSPNNVQSLAAPSDRTKSARCCACIMSSACSASKHGIDASGKSMSVFKSTCTPPRLLDVAGICGTSSTALCLKRAPLIYQHGNLAQNGIPSQPSTKLGASGHVRTKVEHLVQGWFSTCRYQFFYGGWRDSKQQAVNNISSSLNLIR